MQQKTYIIQHLPSSGDFDYSEHGSVEAAWESEKSEAWVQYNARYYLFAMMFVLFDVEAAFLIPWAVGFKTLILNPMLGWLALAEMVLFLAILGLALIYAWRKGALEWVS